MRERGPEEAVRLIRIRGPLLNLFPWNHSENILERFLSHPPSEPTIPPYQYVKLGSKLVKATGEE